jgi:hypothetical protein
MRKNSNILNKLVILIIILSISFILTSCSNDNYVEEDTTYYINTEASSVNGVTLNLFLSDNSCIILRKDGTASIYIESSSALFSLASIYLSTGMLDFDVRDAIEWLVDDYIPGFTLDDMETSFELLQKSLGITFTGVDFDNPEISALFDEIALTNEIPKDISALNGFGIEYDAVYDIQYLTSAYSGNYTAVYMGEHDENSEPFTIMTIVTDEETNTEQIILRKEFFDINLIAVK